MRSLGGYATLGMLNAHVPVAGWGTKTPFATIRRIVQQDPRFFKIRPGLWALTERQAKILKQFDLSATQPEQTKEDFDHYYYQGLLVEIGKLKNFETFIPYQDKNRLFLQKPLGSVATIEKIPAFTYERVVQRAATIDVTWFNHRQFPHSFFEVEHSTDFYNSLLKFVELQDFFARFFVVADTARKKEFLHKMNGEAFRAIANRVDFLS